MMLLSIALFTSLLTAPSFANEQPEIAYAADQAEVNLDSLQYETEELTALAVWQNASDQLAMALTKQEFKKQEYIRAKQLSESNIITIEAFVIADFLYQCSQNDVTRLKAEMNYARARVTYARLKLLQMGNPGTNNELALAEAQLAEREGLLETLRGGLASLEHEKRIVALKLEGGHKLLERNVVGQADLDIRDFNSRNVCERLTALKNQIALTEKAVIAAQRTVAILRKK